MHHKFEKARIYVKFNKISFFNFKQKFQVVRLKLSKFIRNLNKIVLFISYFLRYLGVEKLWPKKSPLISTGLLILSKISFETDLVFTSKC